MESAPTQNMTLIVLSGALLAAVVVAVVIYFMPGITPESVPVGSTDEQVVVDTETSTQFNTSVLSRTEYQTLDTNLFFRGLLPVQPPAGTGKANLFQ